MGRSRAMKTDEEVTVYFFYSIPFFLVFLRYFYCFVIVFVVGVVFLPVTVIFMVIGLFCCHFFIFFSQFRYHCFCSAVFI